MVQAINPKRAVYRDFCVRGRDCQLLQRGSIMRIRGVLEADNSRKQILPCGCFRPETGV